MGDDQDQDAVVHDQSHCPGNDWVACHDGCIYEPCGSEFCYGADTYVGVCRCVCHEAGGGGT